MPSVRGTIRFLSLLACAALLAASACVPPPIAFHDGLPAWTPPAGQVDGNIGYHRMYWFVEDEDTSLWYLTPGVRYGLASPPLAAEVGLTSTIYESEGDFGAYLGPMLGIGYRTPGFCVVARPSLFVLGIDKDTVQFELKDAYFQLSLLAGNGYQANRFNFSGGGRISDYGMGPVFLVDRNIGPVSLRLEGSFMFPRNVAEGHLLTLGLSVGGPAPQGEDELSMWGH